LGVSFNPEVPTKLANALIDYASLKSKGSPLHLNGTIDYSKLSRRNSARHLANLFDSFNNNEAI